MTTYKTEPIRGFRIERGDSEYEYLLFGNGLGKNHLDVNIKPDRELNASHIRVSGTYPSDNIFSGRDDAVYIDVKVRPPITPQSALELACIMAKTCINQTRVQE